MHSPRGPAQGQAFDAVARHIISIAMAFPAARQCMFTYTRRCILPISGARVSAIGASRTTSAGLACPGTEGRWIRVAAPSRRIQRMIMDTQQRPARQGHRQDHPCYEPENSEVNSVAHRPLKKADCPHSKPRRCPGSVQPAGFKLRHDSVLGVFAPTLAKCQAGVTLCVSTG